jgi:hypothetical protein
VSFKIKGVTKEDGEFVPYPEHLPQPTSIEISPAIHSLDEEPLLNPDNVLKLQSDMYWFTDDEYCIYTNYEDGLASEVREELERQGIEVRMMERHYYLHPGSSRRPLYIQSIPNDPGALFSAEELESDEHTKHSLRLAPWKIKEIDFALAAKANAIAVPSPILAAKPGLFGFSIDLVALIKRFRARRR